MTLVAAPDLPAAGGIIHLRPIPSPFDVVVLGDEGRAFSSSQESAVFPTRQLGDYTAYFAWASTLFAQLAE